MKARQPSSPTVPRIPEEAFLDPACFPIDSVLKLALSKDRRELNTALDLLNCMCNDERREAGVFLIGLLVTCGEDWDRRGAILHALRDVHTEECVRVLFSELKTIRSTNTTRRYLKEVIDMLAFMPPALVLSGFQELADDKSFTTRMRDKFRDVLDDLASQQWRGD